MINKGHLEDGFNLLSRFVLTQLLDSVECPAGASVVRRRFGANRSWLLCSLSQRSTGFLPSGTAGPDYAGGGALYALGLTYTNHGTHKTAAHPGDQDTITYLRTQLESAAQRPEEMEVLIHGASLGIGLAALARSAAQQRTQNLQLPRNIRNTFHR